MERAIPIPAKFGALALRAAALTLILSPCLPNAAAAESVYRRGASGDAATMDPQKTATVPESDVLLDLFEPLLSYDAKGELIPGAAESWTVSADGTVYTFKLREEKWSNGDPLRAGDFVFALRRLVDPATAAQYANLLYPIKNAEAVNQKKMAIETLGAKAIDERTLEIALERPTPYILGLLAHQTTAPVDEASVKKFGDAFVQPANLATNGPYTLAEFTPNDKTVLVKNPNFHDAANVKIDKEIFLPLEDRAAALRRFQAGEIDSYADAPADQIKFIRENLKDELKISPLLGTYYFAFNVTKKPFDDPRVRNALSMAVDREFLAEQIWGGAMLPGYSFVPPGIANYGQPVFMDFKGLSSIEREDKARALLKEAGYGPGGKPLKIEIRFNTSENHKNTSVALAEMWKPLGVEATFVNTDIKTHYALLQNGGDYDLARAGWNGDYSDPQNFLFLAIGSNKGLNYSRYANPEYDALMAKAEGERDLAARAKILAAAEVILLRDQPIMPLLYYSSKNLISKKLMGWQPNILDRHLARYLSIAP